jgi:adenylate kinase family enzyme
MISPFDLNTLGDRIAIIGPSSSGKSTLAARLGAAIGAEVVHLDLLAHYSDTQWQARPKAELKTLHDSALTAGRWIMEGNYGFTMPQRFQRATAVIWLDFSPWGCVMRYIRRCFAPASRRKGALPGAVERLKWQMIRYILIDSPPKRKAYAAMIADHASVHIRLRSMPELQAFCARLPQQAPSRYR